MCSISGFVHLDGNALVAPETYMPQMVRRGADRGRDSWGVATSTGQWIGGAGTIHQADDVKFETLAPAVWAIANNRAEPTTERQGVKTRANIQPARVLQFLDEHRRFSPCSSPIPSNERPVQVGH